MSTYFVSDDRMLLHRCEWDGTHIEKPGRLSTILSALADGDKNSLLAQCQVLESAEASLADIHLVHTPELTDKIRATEDMSLVGLV